MKKLSIILPVYNEGKTLKNFIDEWNSKIATIENFSYEFIICEDGSTDNSKDIILSLEKNYPIKNLSSFERRGYGKAIIEGLKSSNSEYILCVDSDGQIKSESLIDILKKLPIEDGFVIGSRSPRKDPLLRIIYSKVFKIFHDSIINSKISDPSCPFVLGKSSEFKKIPNNLLLYMREGFWWGFVAICTVKKIKLKEIKILHFSREQGVSQIYKIFKMPGIIYRNILGLIKIKLFHKKY